MSRSQGCLLHALLDNKRWLCMLAQSLKHGSVKKHSLTDHIVLSYFVLVDVILLVISPTSN